MKTWSYTGRGRDGKAHYILEEAPWWVFLLEGVALAICDAFCSFPEIPLPNFIKIKTEEGRVSLKDWYGNLQTIYHVFVDVPICQWCWKKRRKIIWVDRGWEELKKDHPEDWLWFVEEEERYEDFKRWLEEEGRLSKSKEDKKKGREK